MSDRSHRTPEVIEKMRRAQNSPELIELHRQLRLGWHHTAEAKEKNRQASLGVQRTPETREKMRQSHLGKHPTTETVQKMRQSLGTPEAREKNRRAHSGDNVSSETRDKMRRSHLGKQLNPRHREHMVQAHRTPEARAHAHQSHLGKHPTPETKDKLRKSTKRLLENPEYLEKRSKGLHSKTKPEKHLDRLLHALYPNEFKYNGRFDCGITIDRLTPDFVNVNGRKQVIDVHGSYYHEGEDVNERMARYAKYGYSSLIIWDHELKDEKAVVQRIVDFVGNAPHHYFETNVVAKEGD